MGWWGGVCMCVCIVRMECICLPVCVHMRVCACVCARQDALQRHRPSFYNRYHNSSSTFSVALSCKKWTRVARAGRNAQRALLQGRPRDALSAWPRRAKRVCCLPGAPQRESDETIRILGSVWLKPSNAKLFCIGANCALCKRRETRAI